MCGSLLYQEEDEEQDEVFDRVVRVATLFVYKQFDAGPCRCSLLGALALLVVVVRVRGIVGGSSVVHDCI